MALKALGFEFAHYMKRNSGPVYEDYLFKDTETLTKGDFVNLESGEVDLAVSGDTAGIGLADETLSGTDSTTYIRVIRDLEGDAVYRVTDANVRTELDRLDISGTTGAMTVTTDSDSDVIVVQNSTATEPTLVRFHPRFYGLEIT